MKTNKKLLVGFIICLLIFPLLYFTADRLPVIGTGTDSGTASGKKVSLDWPVTDLTGETKNLKDVLGGKVLFLNFWATWCPPCVGEMPSIEKLYGIFKDRVSFACISNDGPGKLRGFRESNRLTVPIYHIKGAPPRDFRVSGIPTTYILSDDGKVLQRHVGGADWAQSSVVDYLEKVLADMNEG